MADSLSELIDRLKAVVDHDPERVLRHGFDNPHSYRGDYSELAFEPAENVRVADMLRDARAALGATYQGYKGGDYTMESWTPIHLAEYGSTGETLGKVLLNYMLADVAPQQSDDSAAASRLRQSHFGSGFDAGKRARDAEIERLRAALEADRLDFEEIKSRYGKVCPEFEVCTHPWCESSVGAWMVADRALARHGSEAA